MSVSLPSLIPGVGHEYSHVVTLGVACTALIAAGLSARNSLSKLGEEAHVPDKKLSIRWAVDSVVQFVSGLAEMVIGHGSEKYVPMFCSIFVFVLVNNLIGVIPGMVPATENLNTTLAMGIIMFLVYNFMGFKANGVGYLKHFLGPVIWLAPLMVVIELISHLVRPVSLGLRLANVMGGDHVVLGVFTDLIPLGVPILFYLLGMFVCFVQAFVFTLLSMVYISLATAHDH
jgi:F-type H+-transporting ATPase subunit a